MMNANTSAALKAYGAMYKTHQASDGDEVMADESGKMYLTWYTQTAKFGIRNARVVTNEGVERTVNLEFSRFTGTMIHASKMLKQISTTLPDQSANAKKGAVITTSSLLTKKALFEANPVTGIKISDEITTLSGFYPKGAIKRTAVIKYVLGIVIPSASFTEPNGDVIVINNAVFKELYFTIKGGKDFEEKYVKTMINYAKEAAEFAAAVKADNGTVLPYYAMQFDFAPGDKYEATYYENNNAKTTTLTHLNVAVNGGLPNEKLAAELNEMVDYEYEEDGKKLITPLEFARTINLEQAKYIKEATFIIDTANYVKALELEVNINTPAKLAINHDSVHHGATYDQAPDSPTLDVPDVL